MTEYGSTTPEPLECMAIPWEKNSLRADMGGNDNDARNRRFGTVREQRIMGAGVEAATSPNQLDYQAGNQAPPCARALCGALPRAEFLGPDCTLSPRAVV